MNTTFISLKEQARDALNQQLKAAGKDLNAKEAAYKKYDKALADAQAVAQSQAKTACNNLFTTRQDSALKAIKDAYALLGQAKSALEEARCAKADVPALPPVPTACAVENPCPSASFPLPQGA